MKNNRGGKHSDGRDGSAPWMNGREMWNVEDIYRYAELVFDREDLGEFHSECYP